MAPRLPGDGRRDPRAVVAQVRELVDALAGLGVEREAHAAHELLQ